MIKREDEGGGKGAHNKWVKIWYGIAWEKGMILINIVHFDGLNVPRLW